MKEFELRSLYGCTGSYTAVLYNRLGGYYTEKRFYTTPKKKYFTNCVTNIIVRLQGGFNYEKI